MTEPILRNVADTALWVAHFRAEESERPDALFKDPYAQQLAGEKGRQIADSMKGTSKYTCWTVTIRTVLIDRFIENAIKEGVDTILNLGAGLDTRPYRMNLPESLRWIEVDQPEIIEHKEKLLATEKPRCHLERVKLDLAHREARRAMLAKVAGSSKKTLVLTEGVLPYLTEDQVATLAADLRAQPSNQYWVCEYFNKFVYRYIDTPRRRKQMGNAPFQFFPEEWFAFFEKNGWIRHEVKYFGEETLKLKRKIPGPWFAFVFKLIMSRKKQEAFLRMTGYVLFKMKAS